VCCCVVLCCVCVSDSLCAIYPLVYRIEKDVQAVPRLSLCIDKDSEYFWELERGRREGEERSQRESGGVNHWR